LQVATTFQNTKQVNMVAIMIVILIGT